MEPMTCSQNNQHICSSDAYCQTSKTRPQYHRTYKAISIFPFSAYLIILLHAAKKSAL